MTQAEALTILKTGANVFLTGEPGAGKTHTVNAYVRYLREHEIEPAITASTGIAATHIGGMTVHSWSGIGIRPFLDAYALDAIASNEYVAKRISKTKVLIVDEISMLSSDMVDMLDMVCREVRHTDEAFGGMQVVFVGDFFQLPPVSRESTRAQFAYHSQAWKNAVPLVCYLSEQHRQDDQAYLSLLSALRSGTLDEDHVEYLNQRQVLPKDAPEAVTRLFSHNTAVDQVNEQELAKLPGDIKTFVMQSTGKPAVVASLKKGCTSPETLQLKIGSIVMCTKNNPKAGFVNGTLGTVDSFDRTLTYPTIRTHDGRLVQVEPMEWTVEEEGKVRGQITQIPLRLAWAITVHKSQGMSLDAAVMDLSRVFEYGQGYVALSRVRRHSGIYLLGLNAHACKVHPEILEKDGAFKILSENAANAFEEMTESDITKMHENFIRASGGTLTAHTPQPASAVEKKMDTKEKTLQLWNDGKDIAGIAAERGLSPQTIFDHLEHLVQTKKISKDALARIVSAKVAKGQKRILATFASLETDKLAPVHEALKGKYTYDELRIARMLR